MRKECKGKVEICVLVYFSGIEIIRTNILKSKLKIPVSKKDTGTIIYRVTTPVRLRLAAGRPHRAQIMR